MGSHGRAPSGLIFRAFIFCDATKVQNREPELQNNERVGVIVPAPANPEKIAEQKNLEGPLALPFRLRGDESRGKQRRDHRGPLQVLHPVHRGKRLDNNFRPLW